MEGLAAGAQVVYLSTPITTGPRYLAWRRANTSLGLPPDTTTDFQLRAEVIAENIRSVAPLRKKIRNSFPKAYVIDPTGLNRPGWEQVDYHRFWLEVIDRFAEAVVLAPGWEYSAGCALEFSAALERDLAILDHDVKPMDLRVARSSLVHAKRELHEAALPLEEINDALEALTSALAGSSAEPRESALKDDRLYEASRWANVAQFASFDPSLRPRHVLLREGLPGTLDVNSVVAALIERSGESSVNVRSFRQGESKGSPFTYGLQTVDRVVAELRRLGALGYYTIVNETIDVHDGGVSGVCVGGVVEFAPDATPRVVEWEEAVQLPVETARLVLSTVYSTIITIPEIEAVRVEFSVHPRRVGTRNGHVCVWEVEDVDVDPLTAVTNWPNSFSRLIGDKCFGLMLAYANGANVPRTRVISRRLAPFSFGFPTGTGEWWLRTAPHQQEPGRFTTIPRWSDPYLLLGKEDPTGQQIASVLAQEAVDAEFSGATMPLRGRDDLVEGVAGSGAEFMLGSQRPVRLPKPVVRAVRRTASSLAIKLGPVRLEWAFDGERCWVLQMHRSQHLEEGVISPGEANGWVDYDPGEGLEALRQLIPYATAQGKGIQVTRPIGVTSHVGDLLRKAGVAGRFTARSH